ncbi:BNR repeat-containing protein [Pseudoalteromonas haloplanktis]|uniref:BNR repeat-containing protein n=1 Tax=Pseudoalteromonas haloplanktis TaxID=228 RepID=A0ABU1BHF9_PSEHA|nr:MULTISPECIES: BNR repeat-containing protein [Pseudoalteromonas]MDQ9093913.1 BNR repeat-containing protein [Pseudoalteromonas haloplanktis]OUS71023.1 hypothetical protein B5G52_12540 [Pseudoalteromonas sp. A601]
MHLRRTNLKAKYIFLCSLAFLSILVSFASQSRQHEQTVTSIAIDRVWSGHRIKPYLLTRGQQQFVAYYDANRQMTIAHRHLTGKWRYYKVDSWLGWDSHNYVTMELDSDGHLHVMGNMHADPIEYFRTSEPLNVRSLKRIDVMADEALEQRMTYPIFLLNKNNELIAKYRDGGSGNGNEIYNIYDTKSKTWSRLHANKFLDGEGKMSGYFEGPTLGPDGMFHLIWVWRNTPNAATNHSLSYAKSPDLVNWQDSNGQKLALPITLKMTEVVDPVPPFGGMINGNVKLGFDQQKKPIIVYHKYDDNGDTQIYIARKGSSDDWESKKISSWKGFRWDFGGHGSLGRFMVKPYAPQVIDEQTLGVTVRREDDVMRFIVDANSLETVKVEKADIFPPMIEKQTLAANKHLAKDKTIKLEHHVFEGQGDSSSNGKKYYLSWQSQPGNRDKAHSVITEPSVLLLNEIAQP